MTHTFDPTRDSSHQVRLLGQALGDLMDALGTPLRAATGPELLVAAEELTSVIREGSFARDVEQQAIGGKRALREFAAHVRETASTEEEAGYAADAEDRADVIPMTPLAGDRAARAAEALWAAVDEKGIRGRLYREDCDFLVQVLHESGVPIEGGSA